MFGQPKVSGLRGYFAKKRLEFQVVRLAEYFASEAGKQTICDLTQKQYVPYAHESGLLNANTFSYIVDEQRNTIANRITESTSEGDVKLLQTLCAKLSEKFRADDPLFWILSHYMHKNSDELDKNAQAIENVLYTSLRAFPKVTKQSGIYVQSHLLTIESDEDEPTQSELENILGYTDYERDFSFKRPIALLSIQKQELDDADLYVTFSLSHMYKGWRLTDFLSGSYNVLNDEVTNYQFTVQ
jgi:hypothetical protein